jgi:hypothetical protein
MRTLVEIKKIKEIKNIIGSDNAHTSEINDFFNNLTSKMVTNNIEWFIDNKKIMEQDQKNGYLWVNYSIIWKILSNQYSLNTLQIQGLIVNRVIIPHQMGSLTPMQTIFSHCAKGDNTTSNGVVNT